MSAQFQNYVSIVCCMYYKVGILRESTAVTVCRMDKSMEYWLVYNVIGLREHLQNIKKIYEVKKH